jgi:hypothetical protein
MHQALSSPAQSPHAPSSVKFLTAGFAARNRNNPISNGDIARCFRPQQRKILMAGIYVSCDHEKRVFSRRRTRWGGWMRVVAGWRWSACCKGPDVSGNEARTGFLVGRLEGVWAARVWEKEREVGRGRGFWPTRLVFPFPFSIFCFQISI